MKFFSPSFLRSCGVAVRRRAGARRCARRAPRTRRPRATSSMSWWASCDRARRSRDSSFGSRSSRSSWAASVSGVARLEQRAELAVAQQLLVLREPRDHGHRAAGHRAQHELRRRARCRPRPPRRSWRARGAAPRSRRPGRRGHALAHAARQRRRRASTPGSRSQMVARQSRSVGRRRSARRNSRRAPRSSSSENTISGGPSAVVAARLEVRARADHRVVAREVALDQVAGGREARGAAVEAPEEELHHLARHLGRHEALGGRVERADVQRARVPQRGRRRARRERLVHVHEVELGAVEQILERARHVERQRHRAAAPERKRLPDGHHRTRSPARPSSASGSERSALTFARPSRTSSRESDGATTTTRCPREHSSSESRSTKRLTSWCCSQGQGVTCAMLNGTPRRIGRYGVDRGSVSAWLRLGAGSRRLARQLRRTAVLGDELLDHVARDRVGVLLGRRLHQVRGGARRSGRRGRGSARACSSAPRR